MAEAVVALPTLEELSAFVHKTLCQQDALDPFARDQPSLSADVTTGFGPECVTATGAQIAFPYLLQVHYAARRARHEPRLASCQPAGAGRGEAVDVLVR